MLMLLVQELHRGRWMSHIKNMTKDILLILEIHRIRWNWCVNNIFFNIISTQYPSAPMELMY